MLYAVYCSNQPNLTHPKTCIGQYIETVYTELYALGQ